MTDIVERLREHAMHWHKEECPSKKGHYCECGYEGESGLLFIRAAAEIERLRAALTDIRERSVEEGIHHFVKRIDSVLATGQDP